jgi:hypothetical protein
MKMTVLWNFILCSLVETDQCFRGAYCLHRQRSHPLLAVSTAMLSKIMFNTVTLNCSDLLLCHNFLCIKSVQEGDTYLSACLVHFFRQVIS